MKLNIIRKTAVLLTVMLLCLTMSLFTASATQNKEISIPVKVITNGKLPETAETYTIRLSANNSTSPMPNGKLGGSFDLKIEGSGEATFSSISYSTVGEYNYKIEQIAGANPNCIYDSRKYLVKVTISNNENGGYDATIVLREDGKDAKPDSAEFINKYDNSGTNTGHTESASHSERHTEKHTERYTGRYTERHTETSSGISGGNESTSRRPSNTSVEATTKPSSSKDNSPETGVNGRIFLWCFLLVASGFGMIGTAFLGKKETDNN